MDFAAEEKTSKHLMLNSTKHIALLHNYVRSFDGCFWNSWVGSCCQYFMVKEEIKKLIIIFCQCQVLFTLRNHDFVSA